LSLTGLTFRRCSGGPHMLHVKRSVRVVVAVVAIAALGASAACTGVGATQQGGQAVVATSAAPLAVVTATPALGDTTLAPADPVTITVAQGTITALTVSNPEGAAVKGTLSADKTSWTLAEPLGYGKTYTVTGTALGSDGKSVPITGSYTTVTPADKITSQVSPGDGAVVGVAAPVIVKFGSKPVNKSLVEKNVTITTTPHVDGALAWITHDGDTWPSLDWRPKDYWPAGTTVHVASDLYGVDFGSGQFGGDDVTTDFTTGTNALRCSVFQVMVTCCSRSSLLTGFEPNLTITGAATPTTAPSPGETWLVILSAGVTVV
jgi:hypothetical protein